MITLSIVRTRVRLSDSDVVVSFDSFNDPDLASAPIGDLVTISFPPGTSLVIGPGTAPEIDVVAEA